MKKLIVLSLILGCFSCNGHKHEDNKTIPLPNTKTHVCKDSKIREEEYSKYQDYLISMGYDIVKVFITETTFNVVVKDKYGQEHMEIEEWCDINKGVIENELYY